MAQPTIRWGIIGCGDVAEYKSGPALYRTPGSELVAVMRPTPQKRKILRGGMAQSVGTLMPNRSWLILRSMRSTLRRPTTGIQSMSRWPRERAKSFCAKSRWA